MLRVLTAPLALGVFGLSAAAMPDPVGIPIDQAMSNVTVELCIPGGCDDDTSRVTGFLVFELDSIDAPTQATLREFRLFLVDQIDIDINFGILGRLRATGNSIDLQHALPLTPVGPVALTGGNFSFMDVPARAAGSVAYNATGVPCIALQSSSLPCVDTILLSELTDLSADEVSGMLTSNARTVTVTSNVDVTVPLDPDSPDLGTLRITGTVQGSAFIPLDCPADLTGSSDPNSPDYGLPDGMVDGSDFFYYLDQFVAANLAEADLTGTSDPNDPGYGVPDGVLDTSDFFYFLDLFVAGCA